MRSIGHPVCGDPIYGVTKGVKVQRLMLHAFSLSFTHPLTGRTMSFTAPPPETFLKGLRTGGIVFDVPGAEQSRRPMNG